MFPVIHLAEGLEVPSFFLVISLVLCIGLLWVVRRGDTYGLPRKNILDLSLLLMASSLLGARLMHIVYENPAYYLENPVKIFYLWEGGFVFYGGMILALVATILYLKMTEPEEPGFYYDVFAPVLSFAYGFGRIGCFLAGCCFGKSCDYPWAIDLRHPTQLYALFWELGAIMILLGIEKKDKRQRPGFLKRPGDLFILWLALHAVGRMFMESFRNDFRGDNIAGFSVSTVLSFILLVVAVALLGGIGRKPWRQLFKKKS
ncbi:prolipoprotein diacylglyceryl transferase [Bdellovibrio sp. HCB337]|uniref:prolipoprotein diacylglyceryl transferase n=1 Tax=Bdellovibrio sp. HCB337 TaxID=3394358 RepID=UPI0039A5F2AD